MKIAIHTKLIGNHWYFIADLFSEILHNILRTFCKKICKIKNKKHLIWYTKDSFTCVNYSEGEGDDKP